MAERHSEESSTSSRLGRRSYLQFVGASALALGTTGLLSGTGAAASVVDLGEEGLEDGDEIDGYLEDHFESGNEVHVPAGDYDWNGGGLDGDYEDAALIGQGEPGSVQLHHPEGEYRYNAVRAQGGEVRIENIAIRGATGGEEAKLRAEARAEDATMVLDKVWLPDGVVEGDDAVGIYVGADHAGTMKIVDCWVEDFSDNGLYASGPGNVNDDDAGHGAVIVEGGLYKNNNISNLRLGSDGSVARGVTLVHDDTAPENDGAVNQRNLRVRQPGDDITIDGCDIYHSVDSYKPVALEDEAADGGGVIENTRIFTNSSSEAIVDNGGDWQAENLHVTGEGNLEIEIDSSNIVTEDAQEATPAPRPPLDNVSIDNE